MRQATNYTAAMHDSRTPDKPIKGRGAASRIAGRFEVTTAESEHDGWDLHADDTDPDSHRPATEVSFESARTILTRNDSPDVGFAQSINPFRGCEHGCVYCFARPSHAYLNLSPGLDFETRLRAKSNAAELLRRELARPGYRPITTALGINTDAYQPIEKDLRITRSLLELLHETRHPTSIVTKSALVLRDLDLLADMAGRGLVSVHVSVTTLDNRLSARLEPRAAVPHTRLRTIRALREAGVPTGVLVAPVIPTLTDAEIERILEAVHDAGALDAGYVLLRLPNELKQIWREWLQLHYPDRARHAISIIQQMHGGKDYTSQFGIRMRGSGPFAELIAQRFRKAHRRLAFPGMPDIDPTQFQPPRPDSPQGELFT
ncbi:MAG: PA0069 family radical SAM protein [Xanthomonadales bacterium]|nr:PA0069 family radical SAM protein [Xanthomonadales bacterium]